METTAPAPVEAPNAAKTTPKDFFLWAGAMLALYVAIGSFISLCFDYINHAYPDQLAQYSDPYSGSIRFSMAALIILVPTVLILMRIIRAGIADNAERRLTWVRRWAVMLTLFLAGSALIIDLITLLYTFLGGEISTRFGLKTLIVLLVAAVVFMHFLAEMNGYWHRERRKANLVGVAVAVLALVTVVLGFFIIGSPSDARALRYDAQKVSDLQSIQWQVVTYWQQKQALPATVADLNDPLVGFNAPSDPETGAPYRYTVTGPRSFTLCATFAKPTPDTAGRGGYAVSDMSYPSVGTDENWKHESGETCFTRTIDPARFPPMNAQTKGI